MIPFEDARVIARELSLLSPDNLRSLHQACQAVEGLEGAVAEVGVYRGGSAKFLMACLPDKDFWLFDTFTGLPAHNKGDHDKGAFAAEESEVNAFLGDGLDVSYVVVPGVFPESVEDMEDMDDKFCFVHLDTDTYESTKAGLEIFWPKIVLGGKVYIHDYDWPACPGVTAAVDEFCTDMGIKEEIAVPGSVKYMCITRTVL